MSAWYPSCVANIKLVFDETLTLVRQAPPQSIDDALADPAIRIPSQRVQLEPLIALRGDQNVSYALNIIPSSASVELPGYRQAGRFSLDVDFRYLPIDPRTVGAAYVELHMDAIQPSDFARGITQELGPRSSVLTPSTDNLVISGVVDEWSVDHDNRSKVTISGRDMRGILLDIPVGVVPGATAQLLDSLNLALPIDQVVTTILRFNPGFAAFTVKVNEAEWPNGRVPAPAAQSAVPRHRQGARGTRASGRSAPAGDMNNVNFWDLITRFCYLCGAIPYFVGNQLWIRPSRGIFDQRNAGIDPVQNPTPFAGGQRRTLDAPSGAQISPGLAYRRLVFGRDVNTLKFNRRFSGYQKPRLVRAVSLNTSSTARGLDRMVTAQWPRQQDVEAQRSRRAPSGRDSQTDTVNIPVSGITDPDQLEQIARAVYEESSRGEISGSFDTKSLSSFGGDSRDADLLRLKPGDAVDIFVDINSQGGPESALVSTVNNFQGVSFDTAVSEVEARLGDRNLARVIVATSRGQVQQIQSFFRVSTVKYTWDMKGIKVAADFTNYVVAQYETGPSSESQGRAQASSVPS